MIPVLEVGGTHVSAALVDPDTWSAGAVSRLHLDAAAPAADLLDTFVAAARAVDAPAGATWGVAMPDPFDYGTGIARFAGVGKFGALFGVDLGAALRDALTAQVVFVNDADAFTLGEWAGGAARGAHRCAGITLGTGIGSGWVVDGDVVDPGAPVGGRIHTGTVRGRPLEEVVSRRALMRDFAAAGGCAGTDVREITGLARAGDPRALAVVGTAYSALGSVVGPLVRRFRADVLVIGGSIAGSWDVLAPPFLAAADALPPVRVSHDPDAGLVGAAVHALRAEPA